MQAAIEAIKEVTQYMAMATTEAGTGQRNKEINIRPS